MDHNGQTALHWSAVRGAVQGAEVLLQEGARVDAADIYGYQVSIFFNAVPCIIFFLTQELAWFSIIWIWDNNSNVNYY